ncbi:transketolase [archaeon]|jgi:transketolase|nr:transketolase [archaeon]MBT6183057.1 transketolase [archaeon]MBT6606363.1 transketolase [archaeon]MBT7251468.1 transketolase [archaeon]MBT7660736.1 transketolase [archaeon]
MLLKREDNLMLMMEKKLQQIAKVLRKDSLEMTTSAGSGHPSSCLSCADLMSVLFFNEMKYDVKNSKNPDNDEFIMSKGHAAPILYSSLYRAGCIKDNLMKLRDLKSNLEGHPVPSSLDWIKVATGSLGQGLGVGVGMAIAAKLQKRKNKIFVLMGDSEVAEGSVFEAMELAQHYKLNNLVAIIDINRLGQRGETLLGHDISAYKKRYAGFGFEIFSIDGNSIKEILRVFKKARTSKKPVLILAKTLKGKEVSLLENKNGWHGKALKSEELEHVLEDLGEAKMPKVTIRKPIKKLYPFSKKKLKLKKYSSDVAIATRKVYGETLASLALANGNVLGIDAEVSNSTFSAELKKKTSKQFIEAFIAEQNMLSVSLGLSKKGFRVFASTFSAFLSRAHDQIRMASLSDANFVVCGSHSGVSIGEDGSSQMGLEDISLFRSLNNSQVFYPSDALSAQKLTVAASKLSGITYLRTSRPATFPLYSSSEKFNVGDFKILKQSKKDVAVFVGSGITVYEALKAHEAMGKKGISVAVVDLYSIKPFNHAKFIRFVKKHGNKIVLAEDHRSEGGIGEMVAEGLVGKNISMKHLAVRKLSHSGTVDELLERHKINSKAYLEGYKKLK